jgi:hypothetical protein
MKDDQVPFSFDFDEWKSLAETDPAAFEQRRQAVIESFLGSAPTKNRTRLRGLQWRVDMERHRSRNPMQSFLRIYSMMWDSVCGENGLLHACGPGAVEKKISPPETKGASVLSFRRG